jgi:hypothetical protein
MHIIKPTNTIYTLLNATMSEDGTLNATFEVNVDSVTRFTVGLVIPQTEVPSILDVTITDNKTIRETLTESICNYFISSGQIPGSLAQ